MEKNPNENYGAKPPIYGKIRNNKNTELEL